MEKVGSIPEIIFFLKEMGEVFDDSPSTRIDSDSDLLPENRSPSDL